MAKIDEIREQIGLNKFIMGLISIMIFSITVFVVSNYVNINSSFIIVVSISIVVLIYIFIVAFSKTIVTTQPHQPKKNHKNTTLNQNHKIFKLHR